MDQKLIKILEGSIKLFKQYGLRSISMDEIARSMGMSKKTLYQFVDNKDDLITRSLEYFIEKTSCCKDELDKTLNAIDVLLEISHLLRAETIEMNPMVVFDLHKFYPAIYKALLMKKREIIYDDICRNFERGINEGMYRTEVDIDLVAKLYIKGLMDIHDPEYINAPFSRVFHVMFDTHIRSIVNSKGLKYYENKIKPKVERET